MNNLERGFSYSLPSDEDGVIVVDIEEQQRIAASFRQSNTTCNSEQEHQDFLFAQAVAAHDESLPTAIAAALPPASATVMGDCYDDDKVARKIMEEEQLMETARMESLLALSAPTEFTVSEQQPNNTNSRDLLDMKPAAVRAISVPSHSMENEQQGQVLGFEEEIHPSEFVPGGDQAQAQAEAEFLGSAYSDLGETIGVSHQAAHATAVSIQDEEYCTEAEVLNSKPAALTNSEWTTGSAEAAVLVESNPFHQTPVEPSDYAVSNESETEAAILGFIEDSHPSEAANDVEAEFIGSSTVDTSTWPSAAPEAVVEDEGALIGPEICLGVEVEPAEVLCVEESIHPADMPSVTEVHPSYVGEDHAQLLRTPLPVARTEAISVRATSNPITPITNPLVDGSRDAPSSSQRDAWTALNAVDSRDWAADTATLTGVAVEIGDGIDEPSVAVAEILGHNDVAVVPPLPLAIPAHREPSKTSTLGSRQSTISNNSGSFEGGTDNVVQSSIVENNGSADRRSGRASHVLHAVARGTRSAVRGTNTVMVELFGDTGRRRIPDGEISGLAGSILSRMLLPWSVFPSETTGMWVATVNTNQKALDSNNITEASKALRAFSVPTKQQAEALALAWAPPRMHQFSDNPTCVICDTRFAVFRRPCHCRNCGVCICSNCAVQWPSKSLPDTYNIKKESSVNICKACDWLCSAFRSSLLEGNQDRAVAIHATGNVNLVTPFANVKGELFYPVHCAVLGGNLTLLKWLVDDHCCPLRSIRITGRSRDSSGNFIPILTSKGRSLLGIAMETGKVELIRYLVVEKGMPLSGEKDLNLNNVVSILDQVLRKLPNETTLINEEQDDPSIHAPVSPAPRVPTVVEMPSERVPSSPVPRPQPNQEDSGSLHRSDRSNAELQSETETDDPLVESRISAPVLPNPAISAPRTVDDDSAGSVDDPCIICFANTIDSVITPCGHQICCVSCSKNISKCPVCSVECKFIRVFR